MAKRGPGFRPKTVRIALEFVAYPAIVYAVPDDLLPECIPGVLSDDQMKALIEKGIIMNVERPDDQVDYSSVDLTVGNEAYHMESGSVKPFGARGKGSYEHLVLQNGRFANKIEPTSGVYELTPRKTYVFKIEQSLDAARLRKSQIYGQATAKSSIGRVDVLARLIVDGMNSYEEFTPGGLQHGNGDMFVEVTPMTFPVRVKPSEPLTQLRLFYGEPINAEIHGTELFKNVLIDDDGNEPDDCLSVNLRPIEIGGLPASAFSARFDKSGSKFVELWGAEKSNPLEYWDIKVAEVEKKSEIMLLQIDQSAFYILRSREKIRLPKNIAVYCRAIDETIGEMRIHYAGFVHPFFGKNRKDGKPGTPLIFEVRGHDVNVVLTQREKMARLTFYRMSEDCIFKKKPGSQDPTRNYNEQELKLSSFFHDWPERLKRDENGCLKSDSEK